MLYNEEFRRMVESEAGQEGWNVGVLFSGVDTMIEAIGKIFGDVSARKTGREGVVVRYGEREA